MTHSGTFISTRGHAKAVSFGAAMLQGLAPDGGLYVPRSIPSLDYTSFNPESYPRFAADVLGPWIGEAELASDLPGLCKSAFNFPVPLKTLSGGPWKDCTILELFHGPTHSFKDFGARFMARAMARVGDKKGTSVTILVATSGDTGSAVADGFSGQPGVNVILLYPKGQVSPIQEQQLIKRRDGVAAFRVDGTFDECQRMVKSALSNAGPSVQAAPVGSEKRTVSSIRNFVSSANSINVGRLLPQMVYYAWALAKTPCAKAVCVPSGNLGNLTAGVMARLSGVRIDQFIAAHNANSFFPEFLQDPRAGFRSSVKTCSNAMDVGAPSNFERLTHLLGESDMRALMHGASVSDSETIDTIRRVYDATGYIADPHTAVGLKAVETWRTTTGRRDPVVVLSTAHPAKFGETVKRAIGCEPAVPDGLAGLAEQDTEVRDMEASDSALEAIIRGS